MPSVRLLSLLLAASVLVVPARSQRAIRHKLPSLAYVPARVPTGFRYYRWATTTRPLLRITFRNRAKQEITFVASFRKGSCAAGKEKTMQLAGNKVYWSRTGSGQQAWRCVKGRNGRNVQLTAATPLPPTKFGASGIGIVAASGHLIRP